ncbi:MAG: TlpA family protein disulfide reductase [Nitrospiraceae bacterium]|nr:MAG: TlpA family protein disulfide reductase [Nitrospiraceae bacterium]
MSYKNRNVLILGVFVGSKERDIRHFIEKYHVTFPVGKDNGLAKKLGTRIIPTTVFIAKNGTIMKKYSGPADYSTIVLGIEEILK